MRAVVRPQPMVMFIQNGLNHEEIMAEVFTLRTPGA